jgi:hypothetical protein
MRLLPIILSGLAQPPFFVVHSFLLERSYHILLDAHQTVVEPLELLILGEVDN